MNDLNRLGAWLGAMAQSNTDQGPEDGPSQSDLRTAAHLGQRIAVVAHRYHANPTAVAKLAEAVVA